MYPWKSLISRIKLAFSKFRIFQPKTRYFNEFVKFECVFCSKMWKLQKTDFLLDKFRQ